MRGSDVSDHPSPCATAQAGIGRARPAAASKIAVTEAVLGDLCGLDGVEADGVAETVGVAGDAS